MKRRMQKNLSLMTITFNNSTLRPIRQEVNPLKNRQNISKKVANGCIFLRTFPN